MSTVLNSRWVSVSLLQVRIFLPAAMQFRNLWVGVGAQHARCRVQVPRTGNEDSGIVEGGASVISSRGAAIFIFAIIGYMQVSQPQYVDPLQYITSSHAGSTNPTQSGCRFYKYVNGSQPKILMPIRYGPYRNASSCHVLVCYGAVARTGTQHYNS